jgi:hypothetical protein
LLEGPECLLPKATSVGSSEPNYQAERWIIAANGKSAIVRLPHRLDDVRTLVHHDVRIDGCLYKCLRVDTPAHAPPFKVGERIELMVDVPEE